VICAQDCAVLSRYYGWVIDILADSDILVTGYGVSDVGEIGIALETTEVKS